MFRETSKFSNMAQPIKLAVLDDYHNIAQKHFSQLPSSKVEITVFNDTLPSYSHPKTTDAERKALVERLRPFSVLSTMRERTPFPGELLRQLPNLKFIFGTGGKFESWDLKTMKELGITVCTAPGKGRTVILPPLFRATSSAKRSTPSTWGWPRLLADGKRSVRVCTCAPASLM